MNVDVFHTTAFTHNGRGGIAAGVVLNAKQYTAQQMQHIAASVTFSKTVFIHSDTHEELNFQFFTPVRGVAFCGYPTLAACLLLCQQNLLSNGESAVETAVGGIPIEIFPDDSVSMQLAVSSPQKLLDTPTIAKRLSISPSAISAT